MVELILIAVALGVVLAVVEQVVSEEALLVVKMILEDQVVQD
jgi:hypothetical protein